MVEFGSDSLNKSGLQLKTGLSLDERLGLGWQLEGKLGHLGKQMTAGEVSTGSRGRGGGQRGSNVSPQPAVTSDYQ